jgi:hypothetical protein
MSSEESESNWTQEIFRGRLSTQIEQRAEPAESEEIGEINAWEQQQKRKGKILVELLKPVISSLLDEKLSSV